MAFKASIGIYDESVFDRYGSILEYYCGSICMCEEWGGDSDVLSRVRCEVYRNQGGLVLTCTSDAPYLFEVFEYNTASGELG